VHALMGPNGSGKSTLAYALMGHPKYHIEGGEVLLGEKTSWRSLPMNGLGAGYFSPSNIPRRFRE